MYSYASLRRLIANTSALFSIQVLFGFGFQLYIQLCNSFLKSCGDVLHSAVWFWLSIIYTAVQLFLGGLLKSCGDDVLHRAVWFGISITDRSAVIKAYLFRVVLYFVFIASESAQIDR